MRIFTTAPPSVRHHPRAYLEAVAEIARDHERADVEGMLIYTDNSLIDPWTVAQATMERTTRFVPLVATQPVYLHPYAAARKVSSLAFLYGRRVALNMVAGGFVNDLGQLGDRLEHDVRYERLTEYVEILTALLRGERVTFAGAHYAVEGLRLSPALDAELMPDLFLSGASQACLAASARLGATRLSYTKPLEAIDPATVQPGRCGLRVGIVARADRESAWEAARARFPADRRGQLAHQMARAASDSIWHAEISSVADTLEDARQGVYWLHPLKNYKTFCPYLVGDYDEVGAYLAGYRALGYETLVLDTPADAADLRHAMRAVGPVRDIRAHALAGE